MTVAVEEKNIREMLDSIELIESVSREPPPADKGRSQLLEAARRLLAQIQPSGWRSRPGCWA